LVVEEQTQPDVGLIKCARNWKRSSFVQHSLVAIVRPTRKPLLLTARIMTISLINKACPTPIGVDRATRRDRN